MKLDEGEKEILESVERGEWRTMKRGRSNIEPTNQQVLHHRGNYLVCRQWLAAGGGDALASRSLPSRDCRIERRLLHIEFRDGGETVPWKVTAGEVDCVEPTDRVHRAVNVGKEVFEGVVTFFLDRPDAEPQPVDDSK